MFFTGQLKLELGDQFDRFFHNINNKTSEENNLHRNLIVG